MTNRIPELQHYLHDRGESARGEYSKLEKSGIGKAVVYMKEGDMERAKEIIAKLVCLFSLLMKGFILFILLSAQCTCPYKCILRSTFKTPCPLVLSVDNL